MRFSVIIPCFNAGRWIAAALRSVAEQTFPAHEIIVIDDGSRDDSLEQIRASGVLVKLLQTHGANAAGARNAGIEIATGDWIALLDADDIWYPNHLARGRELLGGTGDVAFMSHHDWIDLEGRPIPIPPGFHVPVDHPSPGLPGERFLEMLVDGFHFGHLTVLYRLDRVREVGAFDPAQVRRHDIDLWLRMIHGHTWTYDTERSAGYRVTTPGSISKAVVDCEYFHLRALLKNSDRYRTAAMRKLIATSARRLMGLAFVDGAPGEFAKARTLAWPYLTPQFQAYYRWGPRVAGPLRWGMRVRRRLMWGSVPEAA
jgi:glycosyltransferase involved in cell wall biosynthesis